MRRLLTFVAIVLGLLWLTPLADAQQAARITRIGYLTPTSQPAREEVFRQELRRLGYAEGRRTSSWNTGRRMGASTAYRTSRRSWSRSR